MDTPQKTMDVRSRHLRLKEVNHINEEVICMITEEGEEDFKEAIEKSQKALAIADEEEMDTNFRAILKYNEACCHQQLGSLEPCRESLLEAIKLAKEKIRLVNQDLNESTEIDFPTDQEINIQTRNDNPKRGG